MQVYVILFNARTENEGIHTLRVEQQNVVLMFEAEDDALRFAGLLEAQDFPPTAVEAFDPEEIEEFCEGAGYEAVTITGDMLMLPPEATVEQMDWNPDAPPENAAQSAQDEMDRIRQQLEKLL
ncbi:DUF3110 domain-containing protein [Romeria aff. gracilis LEGE 07310]|uniref:DUF3110 domain-containing protein n=1 Tax=Vasconcelosia minhoensis LEGE 07310 TaxID=915328 RepID=A0A8J7ASL1_9CYAN|nr:DUF3110 domain-containing protein [Romeria gracilis]MBE9079359.1 DUF3110 domain-containing protein [Romeria aff. gracilis LEGE 07310]